MGTKKFYRHVVHVSEEIAGAETLDNSIVVSVTVWYADMSHDLVPRCNCLASRCAYLPRTQPSVKSGLGS